VHLACKAILGALTELSLAEEDAPEYEDGSTVNKDVIATLRSLIVAVGAKLYHWIKLTLILTDSSFWSLSTVLCRYCGKD
jgi:hypothetical protein